MMSKKEILKEIESICKAIEQITIEDKKYSIVYPNTEEYYMGRINADKRTLRWLKEILDKENAPFKL